MRVSYAPPTGYPYGTNRTFKICAGILIPIISLITKRTWIGAENIPKTGAAIVANNHLSYFDVLNLSHFLFRNGRAPRYRNTHLRGGEVVLPGEREGDQRPDQRQRGHPPGERDVEMRTRHDPRRWAGNGLGCKGGKSPRDAADDVRRLWKKPQA